MYLCWTLILLVGAMVDPACSAATFPAVVSDTQLADKKSKNSTAQVRYSRPWPDDVQVGCKELRAKKFISDGFCTSLKPIKEVLCHGHCMPIKEIDLPWWAEFNKYWAEPKFKEWRCVEAVTKMKKVQLMCENGETRTYKIKIVKSCRCKSYEREPNRTDTLEDRIVRPKRNPSHTKDSTSDTDDKAQEKKRRRKERRERRRLERLRKRCEKERKRGRRKGSSETNSESNTRHRKCLLKLTENNSPKAS